MKSSCEIKPMTIEHVGLAATIEKDVTPFPWTMEMFIEELANPLSEQLIITYNKQFAGYAIIRKCVDEIELINIAISKKLQGRGMGKFLLNYVIDIAKANKFCSIFLEVRVDNINAIKLYANLGFKHVGRRNNYYYNEFTHEKIDAYVLRLSILI